MLRNAKEKKKIILPSWTLLRPNLASLQIFSFLLYAVSEISENF